jgi:hypothetical protein
VTESIYVAFLVSVLRSLLMFCGAWLVSRGLVDGELTRQVAEGLALIVVHQAWGFWRIHKRAIYARLRSL